MRLKLCITLLLAAIPGAIPTTASASGADPGRYEIVQQTRTAYIWVIGAWNYEICRILTDSLVDVPQPEDIIAICGQAAADLLKSGAAYFYYLGSYQYQVHVKRALPQIQIKTDYHDGYISVSAWDPLPGHSVARIDVYMSGPLLCDDYHGTRAADNSLYCEYRVYKTPLEFSAYAVSDNGDKSQIAILRIANKVATGNNAYTKYNNSMDILLAWNVVPGDNLPWALERGLDDSLITTHSYYYLAGQILLAGGLDGQSCPNYGINGQYATECGLDLAYKQVYIYQNKYNTEITAAAARYGIPPGLIKQVIAAESQFFPGALGIAGEYGLYQMTRDGADTALRWNGPLYVEVCDLFYSNCDTVGYDNLAAWQQDVLINHILYNHSNIDYLAAALKANAYQVTRLLENVAGIDNPGVYFSYLDLWKITAANYHAGSLVTAAALQQIIQLDQKFSYDNYASALERLQPSAVIYISRIFSP